MEGRVDWLCTIPSPHWCVVWYQGRVCLLRPSLQVVPLVGTLSEYSKDQNFHRHAPVRCVNQAVDSIDTPPWNIWNILGPCSSRGDWHPWNIFSDLPSGRIEYFLWKKCRMFKTSHCVASLAPWLFSLHPWPLNYVSSEWFVISMQQCFSPRPIVPHPYTAPSLGSPWSDYFELPLVVLSWWVNERGVEIPSNLLILDLSRCEAFFF